MTQSHLSRCGFRNRVCSVLTCILLILGLANGRLLAASAADAMQARLPVDIFVSGTATLPFSTVNLNTPGGTLNTAWQTGLYQIGGGLTLRNEAGAANDVEGRLLVNGSVVDRFYRQFNSSGEEAEVAFSYLRQLNAGDTVAIELSAASGAMRAFSSSYSQLSLAGYNTIGGTPSADAMQSRLPTDIFFSGTATLPFSTVNLNTPGSTLNTAWQTGLYQIGGGLTLRNEAGGANEVLGELLVNGSVVDRFYRQFNSNFEEGEVAFSYLRQLNPGDTVAVRLIPISGSIRALSSNYSQLSLAGYNTIGGTPSADAMQSRLPTDIFFSGTATLPFSTVNLNTPGSTLNTAWQTGLYQIGGGLTLRNEAGGANEVEGRLLINGSAVDRYYKQFNSHLEEAEVAFSYLRQLNAGDSVAVELFAPSSGPILVISGDYSQLSLLGFNVIPEPSAAVLALGGLVLALRKRKNR